MEKKQVRSYIKGLKQMLDEETLLKNSMEVTNKVVNLPQYKSAKTVFIFSSINKEIDTKWIILDALSNKKTVAFPKIDDNEMIFHMVKDINDLNEGFFGVKEPSIFSKVVHYNQNSIVIVPGVAFDTDLNRIGYGGGYYDKFFHKNATAFKVAIAHDFQIVDTLMVNEHDVKVDMLITELRTI